MKMGANSYFNEDGFLSMEIYIMDMDSICFYNMWWLGKLNLFNSLHVVILKTITLGDTEWEVYKHAWK